MSEIEERLAQVRARIAEAERRSPYGQEVTLVAVTKFHPLEDMEEAIRLGVTQVGENRVQEMEEKRRSLSAPVVWNLQGHLQKNKVKKAVACADLIQSCDSEEILKERTLIWNSIFPERRASMGSPRKNSKTPWRRPKRARMCA